MPNSLPTVLVVGGDSHAAQAFRHRVAERRDVSLVVLTRKAGTPLIGEQLVRVADYFDPPNTALEGVTAVFNFTGLTHGQDIAMLKAVNVQGPTQLARKVKAAGIPHFLYLSSFKVYGRAQNITNVTPELPDCPYGHSKLAADRALLSLADSTFDVTILRLPMLYGGGAGYNLLRIGKLMATARLFPVPRHPVKRSVLHVTNLAGVLSVLARAPQTGIRIASDREPYTHSALARALEEAYGCTPRLIALPTIAFAPLRLIFSDLYAKLFESKYAAPRECVDADAPISLHDGLVQMFYAARAKS